MSSTREKIADGGMIVRFTREQVTNKLDVLIQEGEDVRKTKYVTREGFFDGIIRYDEAKFRGWVSGILAVMRSCNLVGQEFTLIAGEIEVRYPDEKDINIVQEQLRSVKRVIEEGFIQIDAEERPGQKAEEVLENIFNKFHRVARQLRTRHDSRETLTIKDEYDVQDLLHALLQLYFDDIRPEEWTPSYAGGAVRMDFLLKDEGIIIEVKKTRDSMTSKKLGEELIIDREKYKTHPDCRKMYCFVYDPEGLLGNPSGIKKDLEKGDEGFIKVFIRPE